MPDPIQLPLISVAGWNRPASEVEEKYRDERQRVLADLANNALVNIEQKVARLLHDHPETRESDTALAIEYWRTFQSNELSRWRPLELEALYDLDQFESLSRARRRLQNDLKLFQATLRTRQARGEMQREFIDYVISRKQEDPEIRFYLDETGSDPSDTFTGVGGICAIDWRFFGIHHAALTQWRAEQGWPDTLHATDVSDQTLHRHLALLAELQRRRAGLLFLGYSALSGFSKKDILHALFVHLVRDAVAHLDTLRCLTEPRALVVVKEADAGIDRFYLEGMKRDLQDAVASVAADRVYVKDIESVPKGREVMLECADHIAWAMRRRARYRGRGPKDTLAEAVTNVTGFEDPRATGTFLLAHLSR